MYEKHFEISINGKGNGKGISHKTYGNNIVRAGAEGVTEFLKTQTEEIKRICVIIPGRTTHLFLNRDLVDFVSRLLEAHLIDLNGSNFDDKGDNIPYFVVTDYVREGNVFLLSNADGEMASVSLDGTIEIS